MAVSSSPSSPLSPKGRSVAHDDKGSPPARSAQTSTPSSSFPDEVHPNELRDMDAFTAAKRESATVLRQELDNAAMYQR